MHNAIKKSVPDLEGIYITKRDTKTFKAKVTGIIEKIIKRSEDIVNLRGFVLDNTSDFETRITTLLISCYSRLETNDKELLDKEMQERISKNLDGRKKSLDNLITSVDFFIKANDEHTLTDISTKLKVFQTELDILKTKFMMPDDIYYNNFLDYYMSMIGTYRNKLGHAKADDLEIKIAGKVEQIDEKLHRKLRQNVTEVDKSIRQLEEYVAKINFS